MPPRPPAGGQRGSPRASDQPWRDRSRGRVPRPRGRPPRRSGAPHATRRRSRFRRTPPDPLARLTRRRRSRPRVPPEIAPTAEAPRTESRRSRRNASTPARLPGIEELRCRHGCAQPGVHLGRDGNPGGVEREQQRTRRRLARRANDADRWRPLEDDANEGVREDAAVVAQDPAGEREDEWSPLDADPARGRNRDAAEIHAVRSNDRARDAITGLSGIEDDGRQRRLLAASFGGSAGDPVERRLDVRLAESLEDFAGERGLRADAQLGADDRVEPLNTELVRALGELPEARVPGGAVDAASAGRGARPADHDDARSGRDCSSQRTDRVVLDGHGPPPPNEGRSDGVEVLWPVGAGEAQARGDDLGSASDGVSRRARAAYADRTPELGIRGAEPGIRRRIESFDRLLERHRMEVAAARGTAGSEDRPVGRCHEGNRLGVAAVDPEQDRRRASVAHGSPATGTGMSEGHAASSARRTTPDARRRWLAGTSSVIGPATTCLRISRFPAPLTTTNVRRAARSRSIPTVMARRGTASVDPQ